MNGENRPLEPDEALEFNYQQISVQDSRGIIDHFRAIFG